MTLLLYDRAPIVVGESVVRPFEGDIAPTIGQRVVYDFILAIGFGVECLVAALIVRVLLASVKNLRRRAVT
jgi:hypothetical protein